MAFRWVCVIVVWISLSVVFGINSYSVFDILPGTNNCTIGTDCGYPLSVCVPLNETNPTSGCFCYHGFYIEQGGTINCHNTAEVGEFCALHSTRCLDPYSRCLPDGQNSGMYRCNCMTGYVEIFNPGSKIKVCARELHQWIDEGCKDCEANEGICYDVDGNFTMDGCKCPTFRSGPDCDVVHVNVTCDFTNFRMNVCYMPHGVYDPNKNYTMTVDGNGRYPDCVAHKNDVLCPGPGYKFLSLPLAQIQRDMCGTRLVWSGVSRKKYVNRIVVQKEADYITADDIFFEASCSYDTHASASFQGLGVAMMENDTLGDHYYPNLTFLVADNLGNPFPDGQAIRHGDTIQLKVVLEAEGAYVALRVDRCMASSEGTISALNALTMPLILDSCPVAGQDVFDSDNIWKPIDGRLSELETGLLKLYTFRAINSVNIHCTVKLCTLDSLSECQPKNCTELVYRRRKRSDDVMNKDSVMEASLSREVHFYETASKSPHNTKESRKETHVATEGSFNYMILLSILGFLLFVAVLVVLVLYMLLRRRRRRLREAEKRRLHMRSVSMISNGSDFYNPSCKLMSGPSAASSPPPHHYYVDPSSYTSYAEPRYNCQRDYMAYN